LFESLEPRLLLSADSLGSLGSVSAANVLQSQLSEDADHLVVRQVGASTDGGVIIDLTAGAITERYGSAEVGVQSVELKGMGGDDSFELIGLTVAASVDGGADNDRLIGQGENSQWFMTGLDAGSLNTNVIFTSIENLNSSTQARDGALENDTISQIVFVDAGVQDHEALIDSLNLDADGVGGIKVVTLDADRDGLTQITSVLGDYSGLAAVHILSHGTSGSLQLGNGNLGQADLAEHAGVLAGWGKALTEDGDLLLYGCGVADGQAGVQFVTDLAALTGADVAASTDPTGSAVLGGDWVLEYGSGEIDATAILQAVDFRGVLALVTSSLSGSAVTFTGSSTTDALYLRANVTNELEFSEDGSAWSSDLDAAAGAQTLVVGNSATITVNLLAENDALHIDASLSAALNSLSATLSYDGEGGSDTLVGPIADNTWSVTGAGAGTLNASISFSGVESLVGGEATDTLDYSASGFSSVSVDSSLDPETATGFSSISGFENIIGTSGGDTLTGSDAENVLTGGSGGDTLAGGDSNDTYVFGDGWGVDTVNESVDEGEDVLDFGAVTADTTFTVNAPGAVVVSGGSSNTVAASDVEILSGGSGANTIDYSDYGSEVTVNLATGEAQGGFSIDGFVNAVGSSHGDKLFGNDDGNILTGGLGDDELSGGGGDDVYVFGDTWGIVIDSDGQDTLDFSGVGAHLRFIVDAEGSVRVEDWSALSFDGGVLSGTPGSHSLLLSPDTSIEFLIGTEVGDYTNTLDYSAYAEGVTVDLSTGIATLFGRVTNFDHVIGTRFSDQIGGDAGSNWLVAGAANDASGADVLTVRRDADSISLSDEALSIGVVPNVVTNGDFATDTDWTKGTGWSITSGTATHAGTTAGELSQSTALTAGTQYLVTYTVSNVSTGSVTAVAGNTASGTARTTNRIFTEVLTADGAANRRRAIGLRIRDRYRRHPRQHHRRVGVQSQRRTRRWFASLSRGPVRVRPGHDGWCVSRPECRSQHEPQPAQQRRGRQQYHRR
jgi:hypothetical protein